jgi:hypothetical protein
LEGGIPQQDTLRVFPDKVKSWQSQFKEALNVRDILLGYILFFSYRAYIFCLCVI